MATAVADKKSQVLDNVRVVSLAERIADPGPLGLACFALTTFFLSVVNAGLLPATVKPVVLGLALFYGGIVQVLAGLVEYLKGNVFGATAFCSYGGFWLSFWYLSTHLSLLADAGPDAAKVWASSWSDGPFSPPTCSSCRCAPTGPWWLPSPSCWWPSSCSAPVT